MIRVRIASHFNEGQHYEESLAEFLQPTGSGIEGEIYILRGVVGKLLALAVENKSITFQDAARLANVYLDSTISLIEE